MNLIKWYFLEGKLACASKKCTETCSDSEVNLIKDELKTIIKNNKNFELEFMETAISKKKAQELENIFATSKSKGYSCRINVNSIITEDQEKQYNETASKRV